MGGEESRYAEESARSYPSKLNQYQRGCVCVCVCVCVYVFRAEKRSAQASAHPLSQAQGGLFCVLTGFCLLD